MKSCTFQGLIFAKTLGQRCPDFAQNTEPLVNSLNSCISTTTFSDTVNKVTVYVKRI